MTIRLDKNSYFVEDINDLLNQNNYFVEYINNYFVECVIISLNM